MATPKHVLVVDDLTVLAELLAELIRRAGPERFTAASAASVEAALALASEQAPDAVVMDIEMPRTGGFEGAAAFRARHGDGLHLIAMSGSASEVARARSRKTDFDDALMKPVDVDVLLLALDAGRSGRVHGAPETGDP